MDADIELAFCHLLAYCGGHHRNKVLFSLGHDGMPPQGQDSDLLALNCIYFLGNKLGVSHEKLNNLYDREMMDIGVNRG